MSFSSDTKKELCKSNIRPCCALAEMYGILLYCNTFTGREIKIITESRALAQRLPRLMKRAFGLAFDLLPAEGEKGKLSFVVNSPEKIKKIFAAYGYDSEKLIAHQVNLSVLEDDCCRVSFIRGAFLTGGSVTDPMKRYHLELVTDHYNVSRGTFALLLDMGFTPKDTSRNGNYIIYFKQSEAIEDFLTTIGAPVAAMKVMSAKIEKDMRNSVNRRVNCEAANVGKTAFAALDQIRAIEKLERAGILDTLPEKLKETARLRKENPELSLSELAGMMNPPVSKSCLNHRLRKLVRLAE